MEPAATDRVTFTIHNPSEEPVAVFMRLVAVDTWDAMRRVFVELGPGESATWDPGEVDHA